MSDYFKSYFSFSIKFEKIWESNVWFMPVNWVIISSCWTNYLSFSFSYLRKLLFSFHVTKGTPLLLSISFLIDSSLFIPKSITLSSYWFFSLSFSSFFSFSLYPNSFLLWANTSIAISLIGQVLTSSVVISTSTLLNAAYMISASQNGISNQIVYWVFSLTTLLNNLSDRA